MKKKNNTYISDLSNKEGDDFLKFVVSCIQETRIPKNSEGRIIEFFDSLWKYLIWGYSLKIRKNIKEKNLFWTAKRATAYYMLN